jgi:hypothetical protein
VHRSEPSSAFLGDAAAVGWRHLSQANSAMTRVSALAAINAAESRLVESKSNVRESVDRTRSALRAAIARPSTLALVAVASGISGFLFAPRARPSVKSVPKGADSTIRATSRSLVRMFISMFGARMLAFALQLGAAAPKQKGSRVNTNMPGTSATGATTPAEHDSPGPGPSAVR